MFKITDIRKQRAMHEKRRERLRSWLLWGGGTLVLLALIVLFVVPPVLRSQLEQRLAKSLDRKVVVESARFNPLRVSTVITGLHIQDKDGEELLGWGRLYVNLNMWSLIKGDLVFDEVSLSGFSGRVLVMEDGRLSIADLLTPSTPGQAPKKASKGPSFKVSHLQLEGSNFTFEDRSRGETFVTHLGPLNIKLNDFELHPDRHAPYEFTAVTEAGGRLAWKGMVGVSPFRSSGEFSINGMVLRKYAPYYRPYVNFELLEGRLALEGKYELVLADDGTRFKFGAGKLAVTGLALAKPGTKQAVVAFSELGATGIEVDSSSSKALIGDFILKGLQLTAVRGKDGRLDLESLLSPKAPALTAAAESNPPADVSNPWIPQFRLGRFRLEGAQIDLRDEVPRRASLLSVRELGLTLGGVSLVKGADIAVELSAKLAGNAPVSAKGRLGLFPLKADLQWTLEELSLPTFSPYLEEHVRARLIQGKLSAQGKLQFSLDAAGEPDFTCAAGLELKQLALVDEANGEPLAGLEAFSLSGVDFKLRGKTLAIDEVVVRGPNISATIDKDGVVNLAGLLRDVAPATGQPRAVSAVSSEPGFALSLAKISVEGGRVSLSDLSIHPDVRFSVRDFGGQINGLDTRANTPAKVSLTGNLEGSGRVVFEGVLFPFGKQAATDLKVVVDGLNLVAFSPYIGKYAGYGLASGRFNLDVALKLQDRKLESATVMTLDHFVFGEAVSSPEATKLPVRLAVSLLKDRHGRILVDLPVQGSLDDPDFKVSRVVWHVIGNLLTKAATSPFTLLGAAFGGGEELSQIEFEAGTTQFTADSQKRLETLQKALVERPELGLALVGNFDLKTDVAALRSQHLEQFVARTVWQTRVGANPNSLTVAQSPVTPDEREQALRALYAVNHPLVPSILSGASQSKTSPAKAASKDSSPGIFVRVYSFLTGRKPQASKELKPEVKPVASTTLTAGAPVPVLSVEQIIRLLEADLTIDESDLNRLGLDRAQAIERSLREAGVDEARMNVTAPAAGLARVELQLK